MWSVCCPRDPGGGGGEPEGAAGPRARRRGRPEQWTLARRAIETRGRGEVLRVFVQQLRKFPRSSQRCENMLRLMC